MTRLQQQADRYAALMPREQRRKVHMAAVHCKIWAEAKRERVAFDNRPLTVGDVAQEMVENDSIKQQ